MKTYADIGTLRVTCGGSGVKRIIEALATIAAHPKGSMVTAGANGMLLAAGEVIDVKLVDGGVEIVFGIPLPECDVCRGVREEGLMLPCPKCGK